MKKSMTANDIAKEAAVVRYYFTNTGRASSKLFQEKATKVIELLQENWKYEHNLVVKLYPKIPKQLFKLLQL